MPEISLTGVLVVAAIAFAVPLGLGLLPPALRLPSVVLEIVAGVIIGPQVLGLAEVDLPLRVLAMIGLSFLLFLAGLEIDLDRLRGTLVRSAALGFAPRSPISPPSSSCRCSSPGRRIASSPPYSCSSASPRSHSSLASRSSWGPL